MARCAGMEHLSFTGPLWRWTGTTNGKSAGSWHFLTIDGENGDALTATALMRRLEGLGRGWGSLQVRVTVGETQWQTSVFPQKNPAGQATWLLPVKLAVRKAEALAEGDPVAVSLEL